MSNLTGRTLLAAEDLPYAMPDEQSCELVRGELICEPLPGEVHGLVSGSIVGHLFQFVREHRLGRVYSETGFVLGRDPDTVRGPDAAFVSTERAVEIAPRGPFLEGAPDLAVEVLSPSNTRREIAEKTSEYFAAGARTVWVIDPQRQTVTVHLPDRAPEVVSRSQALDGGAVLPGFRLALSDLFEE